MRLLDTTTGRFREVSSSHVVPYAILSHVWDADGEQSYRDVKMVQDSSAPKTISMARRFTRPLIKLSCCQELNCSGDAHPSILNDCRISEKIRRACKVARAHGFRYIWIDSCCIDKSSSAELSEAINSMYQWYHDAAVCYTFLADVPGDEDPSLAQSHFRRSRWFKRGWTLQELIASTDVVFLSCGWHIIGTKSSLDGVVEQITGVNRGILTHRTRLDEVSVARRMSWASRRETTRIEDTAYCLMGIFDINMPTLYGEGRRAFIRLQEEVLRRIPDQSIFAWGRLYSRPYMSLQDPLDVHFDHDALKNYTSLFAPSPAYFKHSGLVCAMPHDALVDCLGASRLVLPEYTISPYGVRTQFSLVPVKYSLPETAIIDSSSQDWSLAILACSLSDGDVLAIVCSPDHSQSKIIVLKGGNIYSSAHNTGRLFVMSLSEIAACRRHIRVETVYITSGYHAPLPQLGMLNLLRPGREKIDDRIQLAEWTEAGLRERGYTVAHDSHSGVLVLSKGAVRVEVGLNCLRSHEASFLRAFRSWLATLPRTRPEDTEKRTLLASVSLTIKPFGPSEEKCVFETSSGVEQVLRVSVRHFAVVSLWLLEIALEGENELEC